MLLLPSPGVESHVLTPPAHRVVFGALLETNRRSFPELWWEEEDLPLLARPWGGGRERFRPSHPSGGSP